MKQRCQGNLDVWQSHRGGHTKHNTGVCYVNASSHICAFQHVFGDGSRKCPSGPHRSGGAAHAFAGRRSGPKSIHGAHARPLFRSPPAQRANSLAGVSAKQMLCRDHRVRAMLHPVPSRQALSLRRNWCLQSARRFHPTPPPWPGAGSQWPCRPRF